MIQPGKFIVVCFLGFIPLTSKDASAQFLHVHHRGLHFGFGPYCDVPGPIGFPSYNDCGFYRWPAPPYCAPSFFAPPPPIIINSPVLLGAPTVVAPFNPALSPINPVLAPIDVAPIVRRPLEVNDPAAAPVENFAAGLAPDVRPAMDALSEIRRRASVLKRSTPEGRARADRSISLGDAAFADQIYARATAKYREAIARAPDYPAAHFRLAHAYVATRQYNLALTSALTALELSGSSQRDGFSLTEIYRGNKLARRGHQEKLEDASLREPRDGGLKFLIAYTLNYGGNPLKAREIFRESADLDGAHQPYVRYFLPVPAIAEADPVAADLPVAVAD